MIDKLYLPDGREAPGPKLVTARDGSTHVAGLMTRNQWNQLQAILNSQWCLFRNDGGQLGERVRCRWHQADPFGAAKPWEQPIYHMYFTYMCIERPWRGLMEGLWFAYSVASENRKATILRARDFVEAHPQTARDIGPKEPGENVFGVLVSLPERIEVERARHLVGLINERNPPFPMPMP